MSGLFLVGGIPNTPRSRPPEVGGTKAPGRKRGGAVTTWQDAHRIANIAAAQAHHALGIDVSTPPIDVTAAIATAGVALMWQPMPRVFGVYVNEPGARPGILVNAGVPNGARRHTAAHELGHHQMKHTTSVDDGSTIDTSAGDEHDSGFPARGQRAWADQEKAAEAFAAWFLMPRRAVAAALEMVGLERPRTALDVYRLSLILGTSYRSTLRQLPNLHLAHRNNCREWATVAPGRLKARLDASAAPPTSRAPDVWLLGPAFHDRAIVLFPGDRLVLPQVDLGQCAVPKWLTHVRGRCQGNDALRTAVLEVMDASGDEVEGTLSVPIPESSMQPEWRVHLRSRSDPRGLDPRGLK